MPRREFEELSQTCSALQDMSLVASRQRQRSEVRLTSLEDAAETARLHNAAVTKMLAAMEATSKLTWTAVQNIAAQAVESDAQTAKMYGLLLAKEERRKAKAAAAAATEGSAA